jgi:hypothetical protein
MRIHGIVVVLAIACALSLEAQGQPAADVVFAAALQDVQQELRGAPPVNLQHRRDGVALPAGAIVVARRTIGGAANGYRDFVSTWFGSVIAEDLLESYGDTGPAPRRIDQATAGRFAVLPLEEFEVGPFEYDWQRLKQKYPEVRHVVRLSWPAVDRLGTYAVVRYELIGRDRPSTYPSHRPWQHASFVKFEKQADGSWKRGISRIGSIWD